MLRFMFAAIVSRKLCSTARLNPAPATAGSSFSALDSAASWAGSISSSAPDATSPSRIIR